MFYEASYVESSLMTIEEAITLVEITFVQQLTLLSSILLGFSFPVVSQLATFNDEDGKSTAATSTKGLVSTFGTSSSSPPTRKRLVSITLAVFIVSACATLLATFVGLALTLILSHYQSQQMPNQVADTVSALVSIWRWPVLIGMLAFLVAFTLLGWIRSSMVGVFATISVLITFLAIIVVWIMLSGL